MTALTEPETQLSELTAWLRATLAALLRRPCEPAADDCLSAVGLTSLGAVSLQYKLQRERGLDAPLSAFAEDPTIAELAARLAAASAEEKTE